jgi:hypothetical protein
LHRIKVIIDTSLSSLAILHPLEPEQYPPEPQAKQEFQIGLEGIFKVLGK